MTYKTLAVEPKTNLPLVADEVQQVINLLGAKVLRGEQANIHGLLEILSGDFDILWFATHGDDKGVYLNDGILNVSEITALVRSTGASLVVLNTCSSRSVALSIYDELKIPLVATIKAVPDRSAFITGTLFARKLAAGLPFREAYEAAKPGQNSTYTFIPEEQTTYYPYEGGLKLMPPAPERRYDNDLATLLETVRRLEILVRGDSTYAVEGLVPTVKSLEDRVEKLIDDFHIIKSNQILNRRLLLTMSSLCVILFITLVLLVVQSGLLR